jgi:hypothetical protein
MLKPAIAALCLAVTALGPAHAASCRSKDLQGVWLMTLSGALCTVSINGKGEIRAGVCHGDNGQFFGNPQPLDGALTVDPDCLVEGQIAVTKKNKVTTLDVQAIIKPSKDAAFSGTATAQGGAGNVMTLEAFQSW